MHFEYDPGDKLFIDFTGKMLAVVDPSTNEADEVEIYVAILGYSQLTYVTAPWTFCADFLVIIQTPDFGIRN
jgi:transposase